MYLLILYIGIGAVTGLLTGLLGGGSGPLLIPVLSALFIYQGFSTELTMHLAVGTALGIAVVAMLASLYVHNRHILEVKSIAVQLLPGGIIGAVVGTVLAAYLSGEIFRILFGLVVIGIAGYIVFEDRFNPEQSTVFPDKKKLFTSSIFMGSIATCFGIGMGPLCVPFLRRYGISIAKAIAIATFVGGILVIFASIGFIIAGYVQSNALPDYSLGYIYLPMLAGIGIPCVLSANIGARLTHKFSSRMLKMIFAAFLLIIGIKMLF